jgi:hypothetical protein
MADGELGAVFRALAKDAAEAAERASESIAKVTEQTANIEERNAAEILDADAKAADRITAAGKKGTPDTEAAGTRPVPAGPPWPVADGVEGAARGKTLNPPNARDTVAGARSGMVRPNNSVVLRGNEDAMRDDVAQIAAGNARWDKATNRYEINGRTYGVEPGGTVYPDSVPGIAKLDRNEGVLAHHSGRHANQGARVRRGGRRPRGLPAGRGRNACAAIPLGARRAPAPGDQRASNADTGHRRAGSLARRREHGAARRIPAARSGKSTATSPSGNSSPNASPPAGHPTGGTPPISTATT